MQDVEIRVDALCPIQRVFVYFVDKVNMKQVSRTKREEV